jgi:hypothetical protein
MKKSQLKALQAEVKQEVVVKTLTEVIAGANQAIVNSLPTAEDLKNISFTSVKSEVQESDAELWARYFALREAEVEAKTAQDTIKQALFERAIEAGYFEAGTHTANFPNGAGKIRLSFRTELKEPKALPDDFFLLEKNDELVELIPAKKKIIELLKAEEGAYPEVVEYLTGLGFELKYTETRTFLKQ